MGIELQGARSAPGALDHDFGQAYWTSSQMRGVPSTCSSRAPATPGSRLGTGPSTGPRSRPGPQGDGHDSAGRTRSAYGSLVPDGADQAPPAALEADLERRCPGLQARERPRPPGIHEQIDRHGCGSNDRHGERRVREVSVQHAFVARLQRWIHDVAIV